jgi:hypothetical protein
MTEGEPKRESIEQKPQVLEIISINGRWGQIVSGLDDDVTIVWLDDKGPEMDRINLKNYHLENLIDRYMDAPSVFMLFTVEQVGKMRVKGDSDEGSDSPKSLVKVFGKYVSRH